VVDHLVLAVLVKLVKVCKQNIFRMNGCMFANEENMQFIVNRFIA